MIHCIMVSGLSLSDAACDALFQAACNCVKNEKDESNIFNDDVCGFISTDFEYFTIGGISGILFEGEIETDKGKSKVKYLVNNYELEKYRNRINWIHL